MQQWQETDLFFLSNRGAEEIPIAWDRAERFDFIESQDNFDIQCHGQSLVCHGQIVAERSTA